MRTVVERAVLTVSRHEGLWQVEHGGQTFGHSVDKEVSKAAAVRRAREIQDGGQPCLLRVYGEHGFWAS